MHSFVLQDWTTIRGASGVTAVTQAEVGWLDLSPFQDVVFWIDVKESTNSPTLNLQTSPTADEGLFQAMTTGLVMTASNTPVVVSVLMLGALTPVARFVRWQITSATGPWDATFRIVLVANSPGM